MHNILIGGAAGDGIETTASLLEKILKKNGLFVFGIRDLMSRIRGGHNFAQICFDEKPVHTHRDVLTGLISLNLESYQLHQAQLAPDGFILADSSLNIVDDRLISLPLIQMAKEAGNEKTIGVVVIGALLKIYSLALENAESTLQKRFSEKLLPVNQMALFKGYKSVNSYFTMKGSRLDDDYLLTGAEAMSLGALSAGMNFYSAYPMSPSTTLLDFFQNNSTNLGVVAEQAEDEIAAINMALGASYGGASAMVGTSGGGFSLMVEALGFAGIAEIPIVIANIQRPGPATGLPTRTEQSDLLFVISASQGEFPRMVISIQTHESSFRQTARAFMLAEKYQIPVILLSDQYLADSCTIVPSSTLEISYIADARFGADKDYLRYQLTDSGVSPLAAPGVGVGIIRVDSDEHDESGVITESAEMRTKMMNKRQAKLLLLEEELEEPIFLGSVDFSVMFLGFGSTYGAIKEAVIFLNKKGDTQYAALCFGDVYPLPTKLLKKHCMQTKRFVTVEQNATGQLATLIRQVLGIECTSILKYDGRQLSPDNIIESITNETQREEHNE